MSELTKEQVQETATLIVESMQEVIDSLTEDVGLLETSLANATDRIEALDAALRDALETIKKLSYAQGKAESLERIVAELNKDNVALKQQIARLESGHKQTIYPWEAE